MPQLIFPNNNAPIANVASKDGPLFGIISPSWQRALTSLFAASPPLGLIGIFVGANAPTGWEHDTTPGLPVLPGGMIWIKKI